jgi:hypothetical protein
MRIRLPSVRFIALQLIVALCAWMYATHAHGAVTIFEGSRTFVIRQGTTALQSIPLQACTEEEIRTAACDPVIKTITAAEALLRARISVPLNTPTRTFQVRTGSGIPIVSPTSLADCRSIPVARLKQEGETRTSGGNVLSCQVTVRYSTQAGAPFLLVTLNYIASFNTGTVTPPAQLPAPTGLTISVLSTTRLRYRWNVVPDALAYAWEFCRGAGCTNFAPHAYMPCTDQLSVDHELALNATARVRVRASRSRDCSTGLGAWSDPVQGTTVISSDPTAPTACNGLVCRLTWEHTGPTADYFRFWWSRSGTNVGAEISNSVRVDNAGGMVREVVVTMPSGGTWYFGGVAYIGTNASSLSKLVTRTVQ